jgi:probable HAF family extracellular repeat protein
MRRDQAVILPFLLCAVAGTALSQGSFTRLGKPLTYVTGISADGSIAVGARSNFGPVFRWTAAEGVVDIGGVGFTAAISRDGKTIVSNDTDSHDYAAAAIWQGGTSWRVLPPVPNAQPLDITASTAYGVSGDGSVVVGLAFVTGGKAHAFRWDAVNGSVDLGALQGQDSRANGVSADGSVIVGWDEDPHAFNYPAWRGAMWWQGLERLLHPFGWIGQSEGTNDVGSVIVGQGTPANYRHAFRYTAWDGQVIDLGSIPRGITQVQRDQEDTSYAIATSDDGTVVGGNSGLMPPRDAFIWTPGNQMMKLSDFLKSKAIPIPDGWQLASVTAITPNGKILGGFAVNELGLVEGWIVKLP